MADFSLFDTQREKVRRMKELYDQKEKGVILATPAGSGKSVMGLITARQICQKKEKILIISQASPILDWRVTCTQTIQPPLSIYQIKGRSEKKNDTYKKTWFDIKDNDVFIISYDGLIHAIHHVKDSSEPLNTMTDGLTALFAITWGTIIIDEAHEIKNSKTYAYSAVMQLKSRFKILTTFTPFNNGIMDITTLLNVAEVGPLKWDEFPFAEKMEVLNRCVERHIIQEDVDLLQDSESRYRTVNIIIRCDLNTEERQEYDFISAADKTLGLIVRQRQACSGVIPTSSIFSATASKTQMLCAYLENIVIPRKEKALVFCEFLGSLHAIQETLQAIYKPSILAVFAADGKMNLTQRSEIRNKANYYPGSCVLISTNIFSQGVNFSNINHVIFYDIHWNPARQEQGEGRIKRLTSIKSAFSVELLSENTIDDAIWCNNYHKRRIRKAVMESSLSVDEDDVELEETKELLSDSKLLLECLKDSCDFFFDQTTIGTLQAQIPATIELLPSVFAQVPIIEKKHKPQIAPIKKFLAKKTRGRQIRPVQATDTPKKKKKKRPAKIFLSIKKNVQYGP